MTQDCFLVGPILFSLSPKFSVSAHNINQRFLIIKWPSASRARLLIPYSPLFHPARWCVGVPYPLACCLSFLVDEMFDCELPRRLVLKDRRSWWAAVVYSGLWSFED
jgi:hypothetical protein